MPVTIPPFTDVPAPGDPVASAWAQQLTQFAVDQIVAQPDTPTSPNTELWYDTDDAGVSFPNVPRGYVAHVVTPSPTTSIVATIVDIAGLSVTWNADPTRRYKVTLVTYRIDQAAAQSNPVVYIADGANSNKASNTLTLPIGGYGFITCTEVVTGLSGSVTRKGRINVAAGSCTLQASSTLIVEDIGSATGGGGGGNVVDIETGTWTPTFTGFVPGSGASISATYAWVGGMAVGSYGHLMCELVVTLGTGFTAWGSGHRWSIPSGFQWSPVNHSSYGTVTYEDVSTGMRCYGRASTITGNLVSSGLYAVTGSFIQDIVASATAPFTWATGDRYHWLMHQRAVRV